MNLITKPYEQNVGFSSMTDEELYLINGGSMSGVVQVIKGIGEIIVDIGRDFKDMLIEMGEAFIESGPGPYQEPDLSNKNPKHPDNQPAC